MVFSDEDKVERDLIENPVLASRRRLEARLAALQGTRLEKRYCAWNGASGRRYIVTVYPVDRLTPSAALPDFESFVLLPIAYRGGQRIVLGATVIEREGDRSRALSDGLARGAHEWHVHLLAPTRGERDAAVADLLARHGGFVDAAVA